MQYLRPTLELHANSGSASTAYSVRVSRKLLLSLNNRLIVILHQCFVSKVICTAASWLRMGGRMSQ